MKTEAKLGYLSYMMPEYLYIPFDNKESLKLPKNKVVHCGSFLGTQLNSENIFSPASGMLIGVKSLMTSKGLSNVLILENDYRDKRKKINGLKNIDSYKKRETKAILSSFNLDRNFTNKKYLIINVTYDKNEDLSNVFLINENIHKLLEIADALLNIFELKRVVFVLNNKDSITHQLLSRYIGSYLDIHITTLKNNLNSDTVLNKLYGKKSTDCVVYDACELFEVHNALKLEEAVTQKFITIYGQGVETKVLYTKLGICVEDILSILKLKTFTKKVFLITQDGEVNVERNEAVISKEVKAIRIEGLKNN